MYEAYYHFRQKPFAKTPDPAWLFPSRRHQEALARLQLAVSEREVAVLVGKIGSGKTMLSRALIDGLDRSHLPILLINPNLPPAQLLAQIAVGLGVESPPRQKRRLVEAIQDRLFEAYRKEKCPVVILDEAQLIPSRDCFDELRLLTNFQLDRVNLFSLILIGQPELLKRLRHPALEPFRQRVGVLYKLDALDRQETRDYIRHRIKKAGGKPGLFAEAAMDRIFEISEGIPRVINHLASNVLLEGMGREASLITAALVEDVRRDLSFESE